MTRENLYIYDPKENHDTEITFPFAFVKAVADLKEAVREAKNCCLSPEDPLPDTHED